MTGSRRLTLLALAAGVLVGAFVLVRPNDDEPSRPATATTRTTAPRTADTPTAEPTTTAPSGAQPDAGPLLSAGKVRRIEVEQGDTVRFRVRSAAPEELHVHGYDIVRDLAPGRMTRVSFKASIEGIFAVELERSGTQVAELRVQP